MHHTRYHKPAPQGDPEPLAVDERQAVRLLGCCPKTLYTMRQEGTGPRHVRIGRSGSRGGIRYSVAELNRWLADRAAAEADA